MCMANVFFLFLTRNNGDFSGGNGVAPADDALSTVVPLDGAVAHELDSGVLVGRVGPLLAGVVPCENGGEATTERGQARVGRLRAVCTTEFVELFLEENNKIKYFFQKLETISIEIRTWNAGTETVFLSSSLPLWGTELKEEQEESLESVRRRKPAGPKPRGEGEIIGRKIIYGSSGVRNSPWGSSR